MIAQLSCLGIRKFGKADADTIGISVKILRAVPRILSFKMMPIFPNPYPPNPCILSRIIKVPDI
jgi:hypothetical protein